MGKKIWAKRITELLDLAKLVIVSFDGAKAMVKAASCRAGGVCSAMDAGISQPLIMAMGRWRSLAWNNYVLHNATDLQGTVSILLCQSVVPVVVDRLYASVDGQARA